MSRKVEVSAHGTVVDYTSQSSTSYAATNAIDGSTSSYWRCNSPTGAYITLMLSAPAAITRVRLYIGNTSYRASEWKLSGSNDGALFEDIYAGTISNATGWQEFSFENSAAYQYIRWTCVSGASTSRLYLYEIELFQTLVFEYTKADGKYIALKFDQELLGDVSGKTPIPVGGWGTGDKEQPIVAVTSSGDYSTSYPASNVMDGSTSNYWRSSSVAGSYLILDFGEPVVIGGFNIYQSTSYYPKEIKASGSNDGSAYTEIGTSRDDGSAQGWKTFSYNNSVAYQYYKLEFTDYASTSRLYIYEIKAFVAKPVGNEQAFEVKGKVYTYVPDGELVDESFDVASVSRHETEENTILLEIDDYDRFESVIGELTVTYTRLLGNLSGAGGAVEDFVVSFQPEDLVWKGDQNDAEHISLSVQASGFLTKVTYSDTAENEHIEISVTATGVLTHIDDL